MGAPKGVEKSNGRAAVGADLVRLKSADGADEQTCLLLVRPRSNGGVPDVTGPIGPLEMARRLIWVASSRQ